MALDRVVLQREMFPELPKGAPPDGWDVVDTTDTVFVLERTTPRPDDASRVSATLGVVVESVVATGGEVDHVTVTSPSGGTVVFSRLAWPGYQATVDGEPAEVSVVDDLFVAVKVPPTEQPVDLRLSYRPPGMGVGIASAMIGIVLLAGLVVLTRRRSPEGSTVQTDA
jgi:hypothetical protein